VLELIFFFLELKSYFVILILVTLCFLEHSPQGMAKTTSDSILGVIQKESWILDHFEIFVNIALNGA